MTRQMVATSNNTRYGKWAKDLRSEALEYTAEGARAALESFYYAFNNQSLAVFEKVWAPDPLIQLNNPLGGILRGYKPIVELYRQIFEGPAKVWVEFSDIVEYVDKNVAVFAGRERGEFTLDEVALPLEIRTTRIFKFIDRELGWRQIHHHGSIDNPELLKQYQNAVKGGNE